MNNTKVILLIGSGRSGTTLLDRVLGQLEGYFSLGEIDYIWRVGILENRLCGCGKHFADCGFWRAAIQEAFGNISRSEAKKIQNIRRKVAIRRRIPQLAFQYIQPTTFVDKFKIYGDYLSKLILGVKTVSDCDVLIDSCSYPPHGFLMSSIPEVDLRVIHLVRDSRGVSYSWQKKKKKSTTGDDNEHMPRMSVIKSSLRWKYDNLSAHLLKKKVHYWRRLRYEDFANQPIEKLNETLDHIGLKKDVSNVFDNRNSLALNTGHLVSGNPMRFKKGKISINADTEWKEKMNVSKQYLVSTLTFPLLVNYNYM